MRSLNELKTAILNNDNLVWNDPDPINGNNYNITWIEDLSEYSDDFIDDMPILIQYGIGSEAQVFLHEIIIKK